MPVWRLQCSWAITSTLPRDRVVMTPHFDDGGITTDPESLCTDLADELQSWFPTTGELSIKAYDAEGTPPVFPQGEALRNVGTTMQVGVPRELAVCLSFYAGRNLPRQRGRLYVPAFMASSGSPGLRPSQGVMDTVGMLAPIFTGLGGQDVDWVVYSRRDHQARSVSNWWVDDEWDIIRSRGLRPTTRVVGTTSED